MPEVKKIADCTDDELCAKAYRNLHQVANLQAENNTIDAELRRRAEASTPVPEVAE